MTHKPLLNTVEKNFIARVWRKGRFTAHKFVGMHSIIERLEKLKIVIKITASDYRVDRERYIELQNETEDYSKQQNLEEALNGNSQN